jgi:signal transduction histidine kinase
MDRSGPRYLVEFQAVVLDTATSLMSAETDEIGTKVGWMLQNVAEFAELDRCYVYETDGYEPPARRQWWTRDGVAPPPETIERWLPGGRLPSRLRRFENVRVADRADLPADEAFAHELFDTTAAGVIVPLVSRWEFRGFVGFETSQPPRSWADAEVSVLRTAADTVAHTLERQRRERRLRRQNDRLDSFATAVSHDLRNPLNVASGFVDVARETGDVAHLDRVATAIDRMETIVDDVLALAREGRTIGETSVVDLAAVARDAWLAVETREATLAVDGAGEVRADPDRLPAVFENLFRNAVEHAGADARVRVGSLDDRPGFFVEDDGPGVPADAHGRVFDEGYSTGDDGSGLGLAIVANVVDAHGWRIDVTSGSWGGARFEVATGDGPVGDTDSPGRWSAAPDPETSN